MKNKKKKVSKSYSFRSGYGLEKAVDEIFGKSINKVFGEMGDDIQLLDADDVYNHRIFMNNHMIRGVDISLKTIESKKKALKKELESLDIEKLELIEYKRNIEKENDKIISIKKNQKRKTLNRFIRDMLLIYVKDVGIFTESVIQELILSMDAGYGNNMVIRGTMRYLENHRYEEIEIIDEKSDDKTKYLLVLDDETIESIKKVLTGLIVKKK